MKDKINIAELIKDCPKGMELDCTMLDKVILDGVDNSNDPVFPIRVRRKDGCLILLTKYGQYFDDDYAKCVIFPKGKTTWDGFIPPCKFKDGDVLFHSDSASNGIFIFKKILQCGSIQKVICYCDYDSEDGFCLGENHTCCWTDSKILHPATKEQREILFQKMKEAGYKWNAETKTLEKLPKFKDGDIIYNRLQKKICIYYLCGDEVPRINGCRYNESNTQLQFEKLEYPIPIAIQDYRFATGEEKAKLFQAIKDNGYKWNEETKTLEKLVEPKFKVGDRIRHKCPEFRGERIIANCDNTGDFTTINDWISIKHQDDWELVPNKFDINTLKPFDSRVLVRDRDNDEWRGQFFSHYHKNSDRPYICIGVEGLCEYKQCIPYKGNEHLLSTTNDCDDFYKTWK